MKLLSRLAAIALVALLWACAHPISIVPRIEAADPGAPVVRKSVAYLIGRADRDREVTTPGGGGDDVSYFPYRDLEAGFFQVLNRLYSRVTLIRAESDRQLLEKNDVAMVFIPKITTSSHSTGLFTWPPTDFSISIEYLVRDAWGKPLYSNSVVGTGQATFDEFSKELGLAGRLAAEDAMKKLEAQIRSARELR